MNKTCKYASMGQWVFAFLIAGMLATLYAAQTGFTVLLFAGAAVVVTLSLALLIFLLQAGKALDESECETLRLKQRENDRLQKELDENERQSTGDGLQANSFRVDEILARIVAATGEHAGSLASCAEKLLQSVAKELDIVQGLVFVLNDADGLFRLSGEYAYYSEERPRSFPLGETLSGQVAKNRQLLNAREIPDGYVTVLSGLGKGSPRHLLIAPLVCGGESVGVMELASFKPFGENEEALVRQIGESVAGLLNELRNQP